VRENIVLARFVLLSSFLLLALPAMAEAAPSHHSKPAHDTKTQDLFDQSARAYREGRFQEAVDKLLELYRLKPEPVLMYNLARAYEALGKWNDAADAYEKYLNEEPTAGDRKALEGKIVTLRAQAAELAAARKPDEQQLQPPQKEAPPQAPSSTTKRESDPLGTIVPWAITGAGAALVGTGLVLGVVANGKHDDAVNERTQAGAVEKQDSAEGLAQAGTITIIAGAILVAAGVSWLVVRATSTSSNAAFRPSRWQGWQF